MHKPQLSQMARLCSVLVLFKILPFASASASDHPKSLSVDQEDSTLEELPFFSLSTTGIFAEFQNIDIDIKADVQNFITRAGSVKDALENAIYIDYKEVVTYLLQNEQIDKDDVIGALNLAFLVNRRDIILDLLKSEVVDVKNVFRSASQRKGYASIAHCLLDDERFKAEDVKEALLYTTDEEIFSILLEDERIDSLDVKKAFIAAISKGTKKIVFSLLEDDRIEAADVKEAFQSACKGNAKKKIILSFLEDKRIESNDVKKAFQTACRDDHFASIGLLIKDRRIESAEINQEFQNLPFTVTDSTLFIFLDDQRLDSILVKESFIRFCAQQKFTMIFHLLKGNRLDKDAVNQGFASLPPWKSHIVKILFLEDDRLESRYVRETSEEILIQDDQELYVSLKKLNTNAAARLRKELAKAVGRIPVSMYRLNILFRENLLDIFDLASVGVSKITLTSGFCLFYIDKLQIILSDIIANLGKNNSNLLAKEVSRIPQLSLHLFTAIGMLEENFDLIQSNSSKYLALLDTILLIYSKLKVLRSKIPHLELARASLLLVPKPLFSSLEQTVVNSSAKTSLSKYLEEISSANVNRQAFLTDFEKFLTDCSEENKIDALRMLLRLHWGPEMCPRELELAQTVIVKDLQGSPNPENFGNIYGNTDYVVIDWIVRTWKSGNRDLFDLVIKTLTDHWKSKELVDILLIQIVQRNKNMIDLELYAFSDKLEKLLNFLVKNPKNLSKYKLYVENFSFEQIHQLSLDEYSFFGPSFNLISNRNEPDLDSPNFVIEYFNERGGADYGGPSRNWIEKMLYAMADPRRHFLKTHGVKSQFVPDIAVDSKVFFALGRLIGKAISKKTGLPFAFHPKWIKIMMDPQNLAYLKECFDEFYEEELGLLDGLLTYTAGDDFQDIWDRKFALPNDWHLTSEISVRNFFVFNVQEPNETFQPKTGKEIEDFVSMAKERAFAEFRACISAFMEGLEIYIETDLICVIKKTVLLNMFSPLPDINVDSLMAAFNLESGEGLSVEISQEDRCDPNVTMISSEYSEPPSRISVKDAFKIAVKRLVPLNLLPGLLGQISGSRSFGFNVFAPKMFTVQFYSSSPGEGGQLPSTSSCNLSMRIPVQKTLGAMCEAVELLARAADDFVHF